MKSTNRKAWKCKLCFICKWDSLAYKGSLWYVLQCADTPALLTGPEELKLGPGRTTAPLSFSFTFLSWSRYLHTFTQDVLQHIKSNQICIILSPQSLNYVRPLHDIWRASPHRSTTIEVVKRKQFSKTAADICILLAINSVCLKDKNIRLFTEGTITFIQVLLLFFPPHDFVICIHIEIKFKYLSPFCTTRFLQVLQQEHAWLHSKMRGGSSRQNSGRRRPP